MDTEAIHYLPQEAVRVVHPLVDELCCNWLGAVRETNLFQGVEEQSRIIKQSCNDNLQAHSAQLTGFHTSRQPFEDSFDKKRDALGKNGDSF